jgi:hypothetical protein
MITKEERRAVAVKAAQNALGAIALVAQTEKAMESFKTSDKSAVTNPTREQLELAAKAAGIVIEDWTEEGNPMYRNDKGHLGIWIPTLDKYESFDLMVAIDANITVRGKYVFVNSGRHAAGVAFYKDHNNDKGLALCAAVFMCAVAIGEAMADGRAM